MEEACILAVGIANVYLFVNSFLPRWEPRRPRRPKAKFPYEIARNEELSDMTIECEGAVFKVHRVLVFSASHVIATAMKPEKFMEGESGVFRIRDSDPETVRRMVDYIYTGDYDEDSSNLPRYRIASIQKLLMDHARVNALADLYDIDNLRTISRQKIRRLLANGLDDFIEVYPEFLQFIYDNSGDTVLHDLAVRHTAEAADVLSVREDYQGLNLPSSFHVAVQKCMANQRAELEMNLKKVSSQKIPKTIEVIKISKPKPRGNAYYKR